MTNKKTSVSRSSATDARSLSELKEICKEHGIKNSVEYKKRYKGIFGLPSHPERIFKNEWTTYKFFFDITGFCSYRVLKKEVQSQGIKTQAQYCAWVKSNPDDTYPLSPEETYKNEWENWYIFFGKELPFKTRYISEQYVVWANKIDEFMKQAYGGVAKENSLCRFVRIYIVKHDKSKSPVQFLTNIKRNIKPFREELKLLPSDSIRNRVLNAANEFLNYVLTTELTEEDEETGEIIRALNASNPLLLLAEQTSTVNVTRYESVRPCLQYFFVKKAQEWIIPEKATHFCNLIHLHNFGSDWFSISPELIDHSDVDCVYTHSKGEYQIWSPVNWIHLFALTKVPLRGRQIAYNDSGEGDHKIADFNRDGQIVWRKNSNPIAGSTKNQSFVKKLADGNIGMHTTTNKTSHNSDGYNIPWIPEDLAYWLIKLRKWQEKYNPIQEATSWTKCVRTNLNEKQLQAKGINCFLFRAFNDIEPRTPSSALTTRLAATLYNVQPSGLELSKRVGKNFHLSNYTSKYTPHSMRVSLITAYIMELGMPPEIVMKVVGHSSIVMSIYYCKVTQNDIRMKLEEGEKRALQSQAAATQIAIEQNNIESVKNNLIGTNQELLRSLDNNVPAGNFVFRDYGICPFAASRCNDGGDEIGLSNVFNPTPGGYLGIQNCPRCRHFITGPVFLGGLVSTTDEILLEANVQSNVCQKLQDKIEIITQNLLELDRHEFKSKTATTNQSKENRSKLELMTRKLEAEYESAAKKMDMYLCDIQSLYKIIRQCQLVANKQIEVNDTNLALIKNPDSEVQIEIEDISYFQQLHTICENAKIYESSNPSRAVIPRSQLLDRMACFNDLTPQLFTLTEDQQLQIGNQLVDLFRTRLKSWKKVNSLIDGELRLTDLIGPEKIEPSEINLIFNDTHLTVLEEC